MLVLTNPAHVQGLSMIFERSIAEKTHCLKGWYLKHSLFEIVYSAAYGHALGQGFPSRHPCRNGQTSRWRGLELGGNLLPWRPSGRHGFLERSLAWIGPEAMQRRLDTKSN
jgi:hypothetical protein